MIEELYQIFLRFPNIVTDSRKCEVNSIFFALHGATFNGNKFAKSALEQGCNYAVVDDATYVEDERYIKVDNTLNTLQQLATYHRQTLGTKLIGITGTNGKTTSKELIAAVLKQKFNTLYTEGNFNNHIGVPLTLLRLQERHELGIIEMGANHIGEINELCEIAWPDFGIITNVGKAHLEGFGSFEGVIQTKTELYRFINKTQGTLFVNSSNDILMQAAKSTAKIEYGDKTNGLSLNSTFPTLNIKWKQADTDVNIQTQLTGSYNLENIAAAIGIGIHFEVPVINIVKGLEAYRPNNNRSQIIKTATNTLILDAYNANPSSMHAAVKDFLNSNYKHRIVVLGAMKELGEYSEAEHLKLVELLKPYAGDKVFLVGAEFKQASELCEQCTYFYSTEELIRYLHQSKLRNHTFFIKGSRSIKLETICPYL